ncbi:MAG: type 1 glutamine amidotransferase [Methylophilaceae bacterium]
MKPIAIFRYIPHENPGYLADFLDAHGLDWQLIRIDAGDAVPSSVNDFSGLVFMGGPMSVNDELPWIPQLLNLIREAVAADIPVLGHCLGGQLMAKALGGTVGSNVVREIGWGEVMVANNAEAKHWFGDITRFQSFHWHGETFSLPVGATQLLASAYCKNQAFSLGKHLALQCHIEMTADMVREWCRVGADEITEALSHAGVQSVADIERDLKLRVTALNHVAERVYSRWVVGLSAA